MTGYLIAIALVAGGAGFVLGWRARSPEIERLRDRNHRLRRRVAGLMNGRARDNVVRFPGRGGGAAA